MALYGGSRALVAFQLTPPLGSSILREGEGPTADASPTAQLYGVRPRASSRLVAKWANRIEESVERARIESRQMHNTRRWSSICLVEGHATGRRA